MKNKIPDDAVTTQLYSYYYPNYTGYAPRAIGEKLLTRFNRANFILSEREKQKDAILEPERKRRAEELAEKQRLEEIEKQIREREKKREKRTKKERDRLERMKYKSFIFS